MMTDPIADMLTRIRNAAAAKKREVVLPNSKIKYTIAKILEKEGYLDNVEVKEDSKELSFAVSFNDDLPVVTEIKRISKPGRRVYGKRDELPTVLSGRGIAIVSTSQGLMTNAEAKSRSLGGEIVCEVY
jgi:small subunit ribosomal protein S8